MSVVSSTKPCLTRLTKSQILLVPTTLFLLTHHDRETHVYYTDLVNSDEFLASHILRIPAPISPTNATNQPDGQTAPQLRESLRESRAKAKQYTTLNGRSVILKDAFIYGNKGFRTVNQVQLLNDVLYYPPDSDAPWIVYYISKPLVGSPEGIRYLSTSVTDLSVNGRQPNENGWKLPAPAEIKVITSFTHLMDQFPMIARQMHPGMERILSEFKREVEKPLPDLPTPAAGRARHQRDDSTSSSRSRSNSARSRSGSFRSNTDTSAPVYHSSFEMNSAEEDLQHSLDVAVTAAIELFQLVDKQQLTLLRTTTDLTGVMVERMIEKYVSEQVHDTILFPRICALRKPEDVELESKIRQMTDIDISQVGLSLDMGRQSKKELALRLSRGVDAFKKIGVANSPQDMLDILLEAQKIITSQTTTNGGEPDPEKDLPISSFSADTLVSLLLIVVIRSPVRHLQARLSYMRHFIFDDTETGEAGYALSTFEAVLSYLTNDSAGLRRSSLRNRKLWQATKSGDVAEMKKILEPSEDANGEVLSPAITPDINASRFDIGLDRALEPLTALPTKSESELTNSHGSLNHVFVFQRPHTPGAGEERSRMKKRVSVQSRSTSVSSAYSLRSIALSFSSRLGDFEGDLSIATLAQTQSPLGESVMMMAVQKQQERALKYLLNLKESFPAQVVIEDEDNEGTTLLIAALQTGNHAITDMILDFILDSVDTDQKVRDYLARTDADGRCAGHYLFYYPALIDRIGDLIPWTLKDKNGQTPLFALCRSYDNEAYHNMVQVALVLAGKAQQGGKLLRLEEHVDNKGNTLLHIINNAELADMLLRSCDTDVNAANDKHFTPLMVASKYGRSDMVRALFRDLRVDLYARDLRGLTVTELAKDDEVRNRIDDLVLLSSGRTGRPASSSAASSSSSSSSSPPPLLGSQDRVTGVIRSFFVEDGSVRFIVKSGVQDTQGLITITTCRRLMSDFEHLARLLALEHPASWIPYPRGFASPFLLSTRPSRAIARDMQLRLDSFLKTLLSHSTFGTHEMVWEFFLVPEMEPWVHAERSKRKAELRMEMVRDEYEPILNVREVEAFVLHAKESVKTVNLATKTVMSTSNGVRNAQVDLADALVFSKSAFALFMPLPISHARALSVYARCLTQPEFAPMTEFFYAMAAISSTSGALLSALSRPTDLIARIAQSRKAADKAATSLRRRNNGADRSGPTSAGSGGVGSVLARPLVQLLDEARSVGSGGGDGGGGSSSSRSQKEAAAKMDRAIEESLALGRELRYTQQTVAGELAAWQDQRAKMGREACRQLARRMLVAERDRLAGLQRMGRIIGVDYGVEKSKKKKKSASSSSSSKGKPLLKRTVGSSGPRQSPNPSLG